jgi:pimeloyl-ACP methyl ester carboxylesterase
MNARSADLRRTARNQQRTPPSAWLLAMEGRAFLEWSALALTWPFLGRGARGDGHPVMVLPGLMAGDASTWPLRAFLDRAGFVALPWKQGLNRGPVGDTVNRLIDRIQAVEHEHQRTVSLVGWSLGGAMAHALGQYMPKSIRSVITLGSPLDGHPHASNAWRLFEAVSGMRADDKQLRNLMGQAPKVPTTNILSKSDGIVHWRASMLPPCARSESIEVSATHFGLGVNPLVLWMIAERLAQPEGEWRAFERRGPWRSLLYRDPRRLRIDDLYARRSV